MAEPQKDLVVVNEAGTVGKLAPQDYVAAKQGGAAIRLATPKEMKHAEDQAKYGTGFGEGVKAAAAAGVRGLVGPLGDIAARTFAPELADELAYAKDEFDTTSKIAEGVTFGTSILASGGLGAASKAGKLATVGKAVDAVSLLPKGLSAVGNLAEHAGTALVGTGAKGLLGRTVQRAVPMALRGAAEGGLYEVGHEISESALGDHELVGERLLASFGHGAFLGGLVGGGLGVGAELVATGTRKLAGKVLSGLNPEELEAAAGKRAFAAAGGTQRMAEKAKKYMGSIEEPGNIWRAEAPELVGKSSFASMTRDDLLSAAEKGTEKYGQKIDEVVTKLDKVAETSGMQPKIGDLVENIQNKVIKPLESQVGTRAERKIASDFLEDLKAIHGAEDTTISLRKLRDIRVQVQNQIKYDLGADAAKNAVYKEIRNALEDDVLARADVLSQASGDTGLLKAYKDAKKGYQAFSMLDENAAKGVTRQEINSPLPLTSKIVGSAAGNVGAGIGALVGGPGGAALGAGLGGSAGAFVTKQIQKHYDFVAAEALGRVAKMQSLAKLSVDFDKGVDGAISSMLTKHTTEPAVSAASQLWGTGKKRTENVSKTIDNVVQLASNPQRAVDTISSRVNGLSQVAPNTAAALSAQSAKALMYLNSNIPQSKAQPSLFNPNPKPIYADTDLIKFANRMMAIDDPTKIIEDLRKGQLQPESVEAVKAVYPKVFAGMQMKIMDQALSIQKSMPYDKQIQLGMMFDVPVNPTMQPDFVSVIQEGFNSQQAPQKSGGLPPVAESKAIQNQYSTEADKLEGAP